MSSVRAAQRLGLALALATGACPERTPPAPPAGPSAQASQDAGRTATEECVDAELASRGLNRFGDPAGTQYAGGTPLFDESAPAPTGLMRDRVPWVLEHRPEIAARCGRPPPRRTDPKDR